MGRAILVETSVKELKKNIGLAKERNILNHIYKSYTNLTTKAKFLTAFILKRFIFIVTEEQLNNGSTTTNIAFLYIKI